MNFLKQACYKSIRPNHSLQHIYIAVNWNKIKSTYPLQIEYSIILKCDMGFILETQGKKLQTLNQFFGLNTTENYDALKLLQ